MNILLGFFRNTEAKGINQWSALGQTFVHPVKQTEHGWGREDKRWSGKLYFVEHNSKTGQYDVKKPSAAHNKPPVVVKSFPDKESALKHRNKWNKLAAGAAWGTGIAAAGAVGSGIAYDMWKGSKLSQKKTAKEGLASQWGDSAHSTLNTFVHPIKQIKHSFGRTVNQLSGKMYSVRHNRETNKYDVIKQARTEGRDPIVVKSYPNKEAAEKHRDKWNKLSMAGGGLKTAAAIGGAVRNVGNMIGGGQGMTAGIIKPAAPTPATPKKKMGLGKKLAIGAGALAASLPAAALAGYGASKVKQAIDKKKAPKPTTTTTAK